MEPNEDERDQLCQSALEIGNDDIITSQNGRDQCSVKLLKPSLLREVFWASTLLVVSALSLFRSHHRMPPEEYAWGEYSTIMSSLETWKNQSHSIVGGLSRVLKIPHNGDAPFVFFHIRKAGGTSLRQEIFNVLRSKNRVSSAWIPCYYPRACVPYSWPPANEHKGVYASHLNYMTLVELLREDARLSVKSINHDVILDSGKIVASRSINDEKIFSGCITNLRPTVSRVVSCWNFRMVQTGGSNKMPTANQLSPHDWDILLPESYDNYSNGCNNEIFRIFGDSGADETFANTITSDNPSFLHEFNKAAKHLSECIIVMSGRCEDSNKVMSHFVPWLSHVDLCDTVANSAKTSSADKILQENASEVILQQNYMDEQLFQFGETLFEEQLKRAESE